MNYMSSLPYRNTKEKGQALLLVLLSMAVILTVTLSVSSKSITDVSITSFEEDALRAFSAAEAGIEKALLTNEEFNSPTEVNPGDESVTFTSSITNNPEGREFVYPATLKAGESATFWFVGRNDIGAFSCSGDGACYRGNKISYLCWGSNSNTYSSDSEKPAVLLSVYYDTTKAYLTGDYSNVKVARRAYDPVSSRTGGSNGNNFLSANSNSSSNYCGRRFHFYKKDISYTGDLNIPNSCVSGPSAEGCLIMARVKMFYNNSSKPEEVGIDVNGPINLPAQGNRIESTGVAGNSTRKVNVFQAFAEPPAIFDSAVFSYTSFSK